MVKGTGFNPYVNLTKMNGALAPRDVLLRDSSAILCFFAAASVLPQAPKKREGCSPVGVSRFSNAAPHFSAFGGCR